MNLIAVSDIFGRTSYFSDLISALAENYDAVDILDPYAGEWIDFDTERDAYAHFQHTKGLDGYIDQLYNYLKQKSFSKGHLLGFSVGASAVWAVSEKLPFNTKTKGLCFYSSQVRNLLHVQPQMAPSRP